MRQLTSIETYTMLGGGLLMVLAAGITMAATLMQDAQWARMAVLVTPWAFLFGAILFVTIQRIQRYTGKSFTIVRLRNIQLLSGICFLLAGLFMIENYYHYVEGLVVSDLSSYFTYVQVVHNNWVVLMLVGAVLQMYTAHRISYELKKES